MDYRDYTYPEDFIEPDYEDIPNDVWEAVSCMEDDHVFETYSDLTYSDLFRSECLDEGKLPGANCHSVLSLISRSCNYLSYQPYRSSR